ncbi:MAG: universal stress protein [Bacteroidia bacterium]|nr:universal stress protein [Bacteroidia bacterium]
MKKILVPIDFSPNSSNALAYAVRLAAHERSELVVLHAYTPFAADPYLVAMYEEDIVAQQETFAKEHFDRMLLALPQELLAHIHVSLLLELGTPVETILHVAQSIQPDLVVMGMRSGSSIAKKIFGSTTSGVIQRLETPMMVVPDGVAYQIPLEIGFATDLMEGDEKILDEINQFGSDWRARITCIHVFDGIDAEKSMRLHRLKKYCSDREDLRRVEVISISNQEVVDGILNLVENHEINLLVMRTHHRGFWASWLHASVTKDVARKTTVPLLVFPM